MQSVPALPPPVRRSAVPFVLPLAVGGIVLLALLGDPFWLIAGGCVVLGVGTAATVADETRRRRADRQWDTVPTGAVASHVDVRGLTEQRRREGELAAIQGLRRQVPGVPLRRARDLVAELTGVPRGG